MCLAFSNEIKIVSSAYEYIVPARGKELIKTDLQIELPHGCYGRIAPRSGLAWKNFIDVGGLCLFTFIRVNKRYYRCLPTRSSVQSRTRYSCFDEITSRCVSTYVYYELQ